MGEVITIGLDIAKSIFQVHGVDEVGAILIRKRISRAKMLEFFANLKPCLVGIEACPAAHHWVARPITGVAAAGPWPHGEADAAELREGLSQAQQE